MSIKKMTLYSIIMVIILQSNLIGQEKIQVHTDKTVSENAFGINEFYFVHQIFADAFFMTDLYKQLDYDEMAHILNNILYKIDKENDVTIEIIQPKGPSAKLHFFIKENTKDGTLLAMISNFNSEKRKFQKKIDEQNSLTRWYFIKGDKLVYRKDLYSSDQEKNKTKTELIDYYLFDDNKENDDLILDKINEVLDSSESTEIDRLYAKLYLGEYYLLQGNIELAEKEVKGLKEYFEKHKDKGIPSNYSLITKMAETELELMKRMKK